jgi:PAS domain S-box-containing protein
MDTDPKRGGVGNQAEEPDGETSIIEAIQDGVFVVDQDRELSKANEAMEAFTGTERQELIGQPLESLADSALFRPDGYERFVDSIDSMSETDVRDQQLTIETAQDHDQIVDVRLSKWDRDDIEVILAVVRDITDRARRVDAAERKQEALTQLYEVSADADLTFEEKTERILAIGCEYLNLPFGFLTRIEAGVQRMVHTVGDHELLQPDESAPLEESYCRKTVESDDLVGMKDARATLGENDPAYEKFELGCYVGTKILVGDDLYGTFCFAAPTSRDRRFTTDEREVIKLLGQWTGYEVERQRFEERLRGLHRISQRLLVAETTEDVARTTIEMGSTLLDLPVSAFWEYDAGAEVLRPLTETDECLRIVGTTPTFERGEGLVWESFDSGEIRSYENVTEQSAAYNPETELRSEVHVPVGEYGVIISASTEPRAFDDIDVESLRLLEALVREAMTAVKREEQLVERGEALQRQNERLEEFAGVVAHDLRNPLSAAVGSLEMARETNEERFFEWVEESHGRMDDLIEELLDIARGARQATDPQTLTLGSIVEEAWSYLDAPDGTLSVEEDLGEIHADETRLLQLFGNLFRNSVEHAGEDVTVTVGRLATDEGFYVADDGPGLTDAVRTDIHEFGEVSSASGTGIGLASVTDIVEAHGWELSVPDVEDGARFEIRTAGGYREKKL